MFLLKRVEDSTKEEIHGVYWRLIKLSIQKITAYKSYSSYKNLFNFLYEI